MRSVFALIHSPLVGPYSWTPVAGTLRRRGLDVVVPSLEDKQGSGAPYWKQHATAAVCALQIIPAHRRMILVGHSAAGPLLPAIGRFAANRMAGYLFVDAGIPLDKASRLDLLALESIEFAARFRQSLESGERFPSWSHDDLHAIVTDDESRRDLLAELHPRSLEFFDEPIPVFAGWPDAPCGYLLLSSTYEVFAKRARREGWKVREMRASHFHMLTHPVEVADALIDMAEHMGISR